MATLLETLDSINTTKAEVDKCLGRCLNAPYPNAERKSKLDRLRDEAASISSRAAAELRRIEAPAREPTERLQKELSQKQHKQQELQRKRNDAQTIHNAKQREYSAKAQQATASGRGPDRSELNNQWQETLREFQSANAEIDGQAAELQAEINDLQTELQVEQQRCNEEVLRLRRGAASDAMQQAEQEMRPLLDRAGAVEREIASGANSELVQSASAEFDSKIDEFSSAEVHHKSQARKLFWAMVGVILLAATAVYVLFTYLVAGAGNIERTVALATGRVAILVFLGFALKYLADLHRAHSEQAIIYCDRKAALNVAKVLLNATGELEQKRAILKTLADIYLNFEDSAFVARRPRARDSQVEVDAQIRRMKDLFEGIKPVLDSIGKVAEKVKS